MSYRGRLRCLAFCLFSITPRLRPIVFNFAKGHMSQRRFGLRSLLLDRGNLVSSLKKQRKMADGGAQSSADVHIWVRAETKPNEARAPLTPQACKDLLNSGLKVTVERSEQRIFEDQEYEQAGCKLVPTNSWKDAPENAFIVGIKELFQGSFPLVHRHIYFGHVYKNQEGWKELLCRFKAGGGVLLDVEFMRFKDGRRAVAEFSPVAGAVGAALGVELWTFRNLHDSRKFSVPSHYRSEEDFLVHLKSCLDKVWAAKETMKGRPRVLVMGAHGRCGRGATSMLVEKIGLPKDQVIQWDMEETKEGGPFHKILDFDVFVNCIYLKPTAQPVPPFLQEEMLRSNDRKLSVVVDVSCDTSNPNNPLPFVNDITTFSDPVRSLHLGEGVRDLDIIAIDHLPSMLPREASMSHSAKLIQQLVELGQMEKSDVWQSALNTFNEKIKLL